MGAGIDLLERDRELEVAGAALERAAGGVGELLAVECAPGVGKTAMLGAIAAVARARDYTVVRGRGVELETVLAYGVVRQLFGGVDPDVLADAPVQARRLLSALPPAGDEVDDPFAALYALHSLCGALAEEKPLLIVFDDAQWADTASLRFVAFLRERLDGLRAVVALGLRSPGHGRRDALAAQLAADPRTVRLEPRPLSVEAAAALVRDRLPDASDALCRACHQATGGNPFYLRSLARELVADTDLGGEQVMRLAPEAVTRAVLGRVGRLGPDAVAVANAVAVFGGDAEVRLVAALTGLSPERVTVLADALAEAGVLAPTRPLTFVHAIVRSAVEADLSTGVLGLARRRAAEVLTRDGAAPQRVALQLLATEPAGDPWVVEQLERGAAVAARGPGGWETAVGFLRRALAEPPPAERRAGVLAALGTAERHVMAPQAADRLESALTDAHDDEERVRLVVELAAAREQRGQIADALSLLEQALAVQDARGRAGAAAVLEAQIVAGRMIAVLPAPAPDRARARERLERLDPTTLEARLLAGALACDEVIRDGTAGRAAELCRIALGAPLDPGSLETPLPMVGLVAAVGAGVPELVLHSADVRAAARATGSRWTASAVATWRALAALAVGELADAEADATGAVEGFADLPVGFVAAAGVLADVLAERRGPAAAADIVERGLAVAPPMALFQVLFLRMAQARTALAQNRPQQALAAARAVGDTLAQAGMHSCTLLPWRLIAARAQAAVGDEATAHEEASAQLELARAFGEHGTIADALVVLGQLDGGAHLRDAVDAADASGRPLVRARALAALGAAVRRRGRSSEAREPLLRALELAEDCGAGALAAALREELAAAGVRPRRPARDEARWELTPSELRTCRLAADGLSNREIAQTLFVTTKTVETHLSAAFRKLDIRSRRDLATALQNHPEMNVEQVRGRP